MGESAKQEEDVLVALPWLDGFDIRGGKYNRIDTGTHLSMKCRTLHDWIKALKLKQKPSALTWLKPTHNLQNRV